MTTRKPDPRETISTAKRAEAGVRLLGLIEQVRASYRPQVRVGQSVGDHSGIPTDGQVDRRLVGHTSREADVLSREDRIRIWMQQRLDSQRRR